MRTEELKRNKLKNWTTKQGNRLTWDGKPSKAKEVTLPKLKFMDGTDGRTKARNNVGH